MAENMPQLQGSLNCKQVYKQKAGCSCHPLHASGPTITLHA